MPSAFITTDKLHQLATTSDEEMGRHLNTTQMVEIWMAIMLQLVGEEIGHIAAAVFTRGQADGVNHDQVNLSACWTWSKVG